MSNPIGPSGAGIGGPSDGATLPLNSFMLSNLAATPGANPGQFITTGGTPHVKTGWTEVFSAAQITSDVHLLEITPHTSYSPGALSSSLFDVGIGGAGSEVVIASDIPGGFTGIAGANDSAPIRLWLTIPSVSRISIRQQSAIASGFCFYLVRAIGFDSVPIQNFSGIDTYGSDTGTSDSTAITAGDSGAWGSWTNVGSTLSRDYDALCIVAHGTVVAANSLYYHFQLGASSTVFPGFERYRVATNSSEILAREAPFWLYGSFASGTQLQMRGMCSGTAEAVTFSVLAGYK